MLNRRDLLRTGAVAAAAAALPRAAAAQHLFAPSPGAWRTFEVVTRLEIPQSTGLVQAWIPVPSIDEADWFRSISSTWRGNAAAFDLTTDAKYGARMLHVTWTAGTGAPTVEVSSRIATRDRAINFAGAGGAAPLSEQMRALYLEPTALIPTDGIVKNTADQITSGAASDLAKARAIYEWIVENTFREAKIRGCGVGDIAEMLKTGHLGGKCADINALFVGLARAAGVPARDIYGIRIAPSQFGYRSLGANSAVVTKAQHCRAEVYLTGLGWVPADPADVRKVALEEPPGNLTLSEAKVAAARKTLFGAWESNWLAYNVGHDLALPGSYNPKLDFLMYPQAEVAGTRLDCLEAETFRYAITAKELTAT